MNRRIRLTAVLTHPAQYYAPWFRYIHDHCPELALTVLYATEPTPAQQGVGFGRAVQWDTPLTDGYRCQILRPGQPGDSVHSERFWGVDAPGIAGAIALSRPDVALVPGWHSVTLVRALWACWRAGIPVLYRGDTHLGNRPSGWRGSVWAAGTRLRLGLYDGYLSVGTRAREYLRWFGASPCRVFDSPHAVDGHFFERAAAAHRAPRARCDARGALGLDADGFVALFVGKFEAKKRPLDLVRAMARLEPGASVLMVGEGELEHACRAEAQRLGVRAAWAGFLNQSELGRAYAVADCLVLPSDWGETWGLVVNEALATGLPAVVSERVGCRPDLVAVGETGEVFPMGDIAELASAIERVRARLRAGHDHGPACREREASHGFDRATAGLAAACRFVTRAPARRAVGGSPPGPRIIACCGPMVIVAGLERMVFEVLHVVRERGGAVHCVVNGWGSDRIVPLVRRLDATCSVGSYQHRFERRPRRPLTIAKMAWDVVLTSAGLLRDAVRFRPTHVLVPDFVTVLRNAPALGALRLCGVSVVFQMANAPEPGAFYRRVWRWGVRPFVDRFVCNSQFTMRGLMAHGIHPGAVSLIYPCAPRRAGAARAPARESRRVIYVGQVIPGKGLDLLLDAVGVLVAVGRDVHLDVVGDVEGWEAPSWRGFHDQIKARARRPDLAGRVRFLGEREDVPALLAGAAVHCCPSRPEIREGFGVVIAEAKEAGIPSVVCPTGALVELIEHGVDGWICSEASATALAEGLGVLLEDTGRLERAGEAARRSAGRFGREAFASLWWAVFSPEGSPSGGPS